MQMNLRLDAAVVEQLDGWAVVRGISRPELVRGVLTDWLRDQDRQRIEAEYRTAYAEHPETDHDVARATEDARRLVEEEPWAPWW